MKKLLTIIALIIIPSYSSEDDTRPLIHHWKNDMQSGYLRTYSYESSIIRCIKTLKGDNAGCIDCTMTVGDGVFAVTVEARNDFYHELKKQYKQQEKQATAESNN